jgi:tetratricopeptide (TPR) repeat protein
VVAALRGQLRDFHSTATPRHDTSALTSDDRERIEALGYVGSYVPPPAESSGTDIADPKDKHDIVERYRAALDLAASGEWDQAIDRLRALLRKEPGLVDVWLHLGRTASRADRHDVSADAYKHALQLAPALSEARLGVSSALLRLRKLDDARRYAEQVAADAAPNDNESLAGAHELLARIALASREQELARFEAELAEAADPNRPVRAYVEGRLAYDQHHYEEAIGFFEPALASLEQSQQRPLADLRIYAADTLRQLDRPAEAEYLLLEELRDVPSSARARAGLVALYRATGRSDEAATLARR